MTEEPTTPSRVQPKKSILNILVKFSIVIIIILFLSGATAYYFLVYANPLYMLKKVGENAQGITSISLHFLSYDKQLQVQTDLHPQGISSLKIEALIKNANASDKVSGKFIIENNNLYFSPSFRKMDELIFQTSKYIPTIESTRTYAKTIPILQGKQWLHASFDPSIFTNSIQLDSFNKPELKQAALKTIIIRKFSRNVEFEGDRYSRIVIGYDKQALLNYLSILKKDIDVSALQKLVQNTESWNLDLIQLYIKDNSLKAVSFAIPQISEKTSQDSIDSFLNEFSPNIAYAFEGYTSEFSKQLKPTREGLIDIGTLYISNINSAPEVKVPSSIVEASELYELASQELVPLISEAISQYMATMPPREAPVNVK